MKCEGCRSTNVIPDPEHGQRYCVICGLYVEEAVYEYYDPYPSQSDDEEPSALLVTDPTLVNKGLGTPLPEEIREILPNIFKTLMRGFGRDGEARSFSAALPWLKRAWTFLHLPDDLKKRSAQIYRLCIKKHIVSGVKRNAWATATAYVAATACQKVDIVGLSEIMEVSVEEIKACSVTIREKIGYSAYVPYVLDYIRTCCEQLHITPEVLQKMLDVGASVIDKKWEQGRHPAAVAGAIVYAICIDAGMKKSRKQIAHVLKVNEKSIIRAGEILEEKGTFILQPKIAAQEKSLKIDGLDSL